MRSIVLPILLLAGVARGAAAQVMVDVPKVKGLNSPTARAKVEESNLSFEVLRSNGNTHRYIKGEALESQDKGKIVQLQDPDPYVVPPGDPVPQLESPGGFVQVVLQVPPDPKLSIIAMIILGLLVPVTIRVFWPPRPPR